MSVWGRLYGHCDTCTCLAQHLPRRRESPRFPQVRLKWHVCNDAGASCARKLVFFQELQAAKLAIFVCGGGIASQPLLVCAVVVCASQLPQSKYGRWCSCHCGGSAAEHTESDPHNSQCR